MDRPRYVIVSPCRNEEQHLPRTLESVAAQFHRPAEWVIVDDGSTDRTPEILAEHSRQHPWIRPLRRPDRGRRVNGSGVMEAFHAGLEALQVRDWQYLVKLDADLSFAPDYFESCLSRMEAEPRLGVAGGDLVNLVNGREVREKHPRFHVRGATKIYRRECWDQIGGLLQAPGWDTLDEVHANMLGWNSRTLSGVRLHHHRYTGDASGQWSTWRKNGAACYQVGYHPAFLVARAVLHAFRRPYLPSTAGLIAGYFGSWLGRRPRRTPPELVRYLQSQQLRRLLGMRTIWR